MRPYRDFLGETFLQVNSSKINTQVLNYIISSYRNVSQMSMHITLIQVKLDKNAKCVSDAVKVNLITLNN